MSDGAWLSLVERPLWERNVAGSNPVAPTNSLPQSLIAVPRSGPAGLRRRIFVQKLQHAIPSFVVLGDGIDHLSHDPHGINLALGIFEVAAGLLVIGSVIRGFRQLRKHTAPRTRMMSMRMVWTGSTSASARC